MLNILNSNKKDWFDLLKQRESVDWINTFNLNVKLQVLKQNILFLEVFLETPGLKQDEIDYLFLEIERFWEEIISLENTILYDIATETIH